MKLTRVQYYVYIILLIGNILMALAQEPNETYRLSDQFTFCSRRLARLIANFCDNVYKISKRDTSFIDKLFPEDLREHMNRERLKVLRRVKRQVANECCDHPCTVSNILAYCPLDSEVLKENPDLKSRIISSR